MNKDPADGGIFYFQQVAGDFRQAAGEDFSNYMSRVAARRIREINRIYASGHSKNH